MGKSERFKKQIEAELKQIIGTDKVDRYKLHLLMQKVVNHYTEQGKFHVLKMKTAAELIVLERKLLKPVYQEAQELLNLITAACPGADKEPSNALLVKQVNDLEKIISSLDSTFGTGGGEHA